MEFANDLRRALKNQIGGDRFDLWFSDVAIFAKDQSVHVCAATGFQLERVRKNFQAAITEAAGNVGLSDSIRLDFHVESDSDKIAQLLEDARSGDSADRQSTSHVAEHDDHSDTQDTQIDLAVSNNVVSSSSTADADRAASQNASSPRLRASSSTTRGRRFQTMGTFVKGECNHIACTSVEMVAKQPGDITPLVIHGSTGVGKSHLVEAIWCEAKKRSPRSRVLYLSAEQYTTYFLDALRGGHGLPAFRRKYRHADILIIDDIQFFAGKQATLVELAYTIDELTRQNRQLILTADRPPAQLSKLGPEIVNRLCGGLVCTMKPIDSATMEQISRQWARERKIQISDDIHQTLAGKMNGDARQLSGVLNRLWATSVATGERVTQRMVNEVLFELIPTPSRIIRLQDVRKAICEVFGIEVTSLSGATRSRAVGVPRMLAMWLARRHTAAGLHEISTFFGRRSHSSAVTASNTVNKWLSSGEKIEINGHECDVRDIVSQIEAGMKAG